MHAKIKEKDALFATLQTPQKGNFLSAIQEVKKSTVDTIIVLDDDPTGTQTVSDIPVLTSWETDIIINEFKKQSPLFFILTNSRSLTAEEANSLAYTIGENIRQAAEKIGTRYWVISRSDSTLRGHYPGEVNALEKGLGWQDSIHFIIPTFFEGGRYTIDDIHYVQQENSLIPTAQTPYAKDKVFGFQNSNLKNWVVEKNDNKISIDEVSSISIEELRTASEEDLVKKLNHLSKGSVCIINAASYEDLYVFSLALYKTQIQPLFRTAASFVGAISGLKNKPLLDGKSIRNINTNGGLIVVGSYVPTSSRQLSHLIANRPEIHSIEIQVDKILSVENQSALWKNYAKQIDELLLNGKTVVVFTSRTLVSAQSEKENQEIGKTVSHFLTQIIFHLSIRPSYLLTKGGITSSDIATKSLGIKRAIVKGQIIKGVPVWELGEETKFPKSHLIIFPGNVGIENSLTEVVDKLIL